MPYPEAAPPGVIRGHARFALFDASVFNPSSPKCPCGPAPPVSASSHQVGRRLAQGQYGNSARSPVASARLVPASRLRQLDLPRHDPAWMVGSAPATARRRHPVWWRYLVRLDPTRRFRSPSSPPSLRSRPASPLHAGDRRRDRAADGRRPLSPRSGRGQLRVALCQPVR